MTKRRKKKNRFFLAGIFILVLLCVAFVVGDVYLFTLYRSTAQETTASETVQTPQAEQSEAATASEEPQIIIAAQPEASQEAEPEQTASEETLSEETISEESDAHWQNDWVSFTYDKSAMWVTEDNGVIMVTDPQFAELPRMDIQQLTGAEDLTQAEFEILAKAAVRAYFSAEPASEVVSVSSVTQIESGWTAELTVSETEVSPALTAWVRLTNSALTSMLLPQTADEETQAIWVHALESVAGES